MNISSAKYRKELSAFYRIGYSVCTREVTKKLHELIDKNEDCAFNAELRKIVVHINLLKFSNNEETVEKIIKKLTNEQTNN